MKMVQDKVTTHGAAGKGRASMPKGNRGGSHAQTPAKNVGTGNCRRYAFPTTGGMRRD